LPRSLAAVECPAHNNMFVDLSSSSMINGKRLESQIYSLKIIDLNWIDKIEYGRVHEIAYGFGGPSENNVNPH